MPQAWGKCVQKRITLEILPLGQGQAPVMRLCHFDALTSTQAIPRNLDVSWDNGLEGSPLRWISAPAP